jgi:DNA-binding MarR family transcriptional regulator
MRFDPIVANAGRLRILTALADGSAEEFVRLRKITQLTDGNLATHARRLQAAGFISIDKLIRDGKPLTLLRLNGAGRAALEEHARKVMEAIEPSASPEAAVGLAEDIESNADEWVD